MKTPVLVLLAAVCCCVPADGWLLLQDATISNAAEPMDFDTTGSPETTAESRTWLNTVSARSLPPTEDALRETAKPSSSTKKTTAARFSYKVLENLSPNERRRRIALIRSRNQRLTAAPHGALEKLSWIRTEFPERSSTWSSSTAVPTTTRYLEAPHVPRHPVLRRRVNRDPADAPTPCLQPRDTWNAQRRPCEEGKSKWYYDMKTGKCRFFHYLGCGESANRFGTRRECEAFCIERITDPCNPTVVKCFENFAPTCFTGEYLPCMARVRQQYPNEDIYYLQELFQTLCPPKVARCKSDLFKFVKLNLSPNMQNTMTPELCSQPPNKGSCPGIVGRGSLRFYYDPRYRSCRVLYFSGCGGNDNRFASFSKCMNYCGM